MSSEIHCSMTDAGRSSEVMGEFLRYVVVGAVAAAADLSTLYLAATQLHVHYLWAGVMGFIVGLTVNYFLSVAWAFRNRVVDNRAMEFAVFAAIGVVGLGVNEAVLYVLTGLLALHVVLSKLVAIVTVFIWNFGGRKLILFRRVQEGAPV